MQKMKFSVKFISLILTLSFLVSLFAVFSFANDTVVEEDTADTLNVVYNRTFDEGWNYDNGLSDVFLGENKVDIRYELLDSGYNHFLRFEKNATTVSYVSLDTTALDMTGKTFIEFDLASSLNNTMGQAVKASVQGNIKTLIEFKEDGMYVLGKNVGHAERAMEWDSFAFEFDFSYAENTPGADESEYQVKALINNEVAHTVIWKRGFNGFGITQIRFCYGNILAANELQWYTIDNLAVYSGVDAFTAIDATNYGSAVDKDAPRNFPLASDGTGSDGYLRGEPTLNRDFEPHGAVNHYNRHYGEGWTFDNHVTSTSRVTVTTGDNEFDIKQEKTLDGKANYFFRFRALAGRAGYMQIPVVNAPDYGRLVVEFDIKAGVNVNLGDIIEVVGSGSEYVVGIVDGQLELFGNKVGYIGNEWVRVVLAFDYEEADDGNTYCTVNYGEKGYFKAPITYNNIEYVKIGLSASAPADCFGDWYGIDNLLIYSGIPGYAEFDPADYGLGVYPEAPKDFIINSDIVPDAPQVPEHNETEEDRENSLTDEYIGGTPDIEYAPFDESNWFQYHRTYDEGWAFGIGGALPSGILATLENEQMLDLSFNYFQRYEAIQTGNKYWTLSTSTCPTKGKIFIEMDVRATDGANFGGVFQVRTKSAVSGSQNYLVGFEKGYLVIWDTPVGKVSENEWVHLAIEFDYDYALATPGANPNTFKMRAHIGDEWYLEKVITGKSATTTFGISGFRIGFESAPAATHGQCWDMDNLKVYGGQSFMEIPEDKYGAAVNPDLPKDFPIQSTAITLQDMVDASLFMKIACDYSLVNNVRQPVLFDEETGRPYGSPARIDEQVWVPLDAILNFLDYPIYIHEDGQSFDISTGASVTYITLGRDTALVAGEKVKLHKAPAIIPAEKEFLAVALEDVSVLFPGYYCDIDDMNMIVFSEYKEITDGSLNMDNRMDIMTDFLFEFINKDEVFDDVKENTNNFDHPYLGANQAKFDELREVWLLGNEANKDEDPTNDPVYDKTLYSYINKLVNSARSSYNKFSIEPMSSYNEEGKDYAGLVPEAYLYDSETHSKGLQHPYKDSAGYDPIGGRLNPPFDNIKIMSFGYQITRDERFAQCVYDYAECLGHWDHWGPGHFLNCADTASPMAFSYDWCYDAWVELGLDTDVIADAIFYHGALQGYFVTVGKPDPHGRRGGNGSTYTTMKNNWNPVCTAGVAAACIAVMNYDGLTDETAIVAARHRVTEYGGKDKVIEVTTHTVAANFKTLVANALGYYAPDGSYEEGVGYWSYGAGNLFLYAQILESAFGTHRGIMDTWGVDRTCRSILHMVSSDYIQFNYNDSSVGGSMNSGYFNYVAYACDDDFLRIIRRNHIRDRGVGVTANDVFYYKNVDDLADVELELQYHHVGIHGYTIRESWNAGSLYAGMLGGDNNDGHGHIDAGQWIYYNKNISFIMDIGPDGYNTYNYFNNNHMYKTTVEGHNCILVTSLQDSLPAGQLRDSISPVMTTGDNEFGGFVTIDTKPAFGTKPFVTSHRGMLLTNSRKTVVIQDEIMPNGSQTFYWIAHYNNHTCYDVEIAPGGRTVYMTARSPLDGFEYTLRIQMVSPIRRGIAFEKMTTQDYLLDATMRPGDSESYGKQPEGDRSMYSKIVVKFENLTTNLFAVALELIDPKNPIEVGYTFTNMADWEPVEDTRKGTIVAPEEEVSTNRGSVTATQLPQNINRLNTYKNKDTMFTTDIHNFYNSITAMTYIANKFGRDHAQMVKEVKDADGQMRTAIEIYDEYYELYDAYQTSVDVVATQISSITNTFIGA